MSVVSSVVTSRDIAGRARQSSARRAPAQGDDGDGSRGVGRGASTRAANKENSARAHSRAEKRPAGASAPSRKPSSARKASHSQQPSVSSGRSSHNDSSSFSAGSGAEGRYGRYVQRGAPPQTASARLTSSTSAEASDARGGPARPHGGPRSPLSTQTAASARRQRRAGAAGGGGGGGASAGETLSERPQVRAMGPSTAYALPPSSSHTANSSNNNSSSGNNNSSSSARRRPAYSPPAYIGYVDHTPPGQHLAARGAAASASPPVDPATGAPSKETPLFERYLRRRNAQRHGAPAEGSSSSGGPHGQPTHRDGAPADAVAEEETSVDSALSAFRRSSLTAAAAVAAARASTVGLRPPAVSAPPVTAGRAKPTATTAAPVAPVPRASAHAAGAPSLAAPSGSSAGAVSRYQRHAPSTRELSAARGASNEPAATVRAASVASSNLPTAASSLSGPIGFAPTRTRSPEKETTPSRGGAPADGTPGRYSQTRSSANKDFARLSSDFRPLSASSTPAIDFSPLDKPILGAGSAAAPSSAAGGKPRSAGAATACGPTTSNAPQRPKSHFLFTRVQWGPRTPPAVAVDSAAAARSSDSTQAPSVQLQTSTPVQISVPVDARVPPHSTYSPDAPCAIATHSPPMHSSGSASPTTSTLRGQPIRLLFTRSGGAPAAGAAAAASSASSAALPPKKKSRARSAHDGKGSHGPPRQPKSGPSSRHASPAVGAASAAPAALKQKEKKREVKRSLAGSGHSGRPSLSLTWSNMPSVSAPASPADVGGSTAAHAANTTKAKGSRGDAHRHPHGSPLTPAEANEQKRRLQSKLGSPPVFVRSATYTFQTSFLGTPPSATSSPPLPQSLRLSPYRIRGPVKPSAARADAEELPAEAPSASQPASSSASPPTIIPAPVDVAAPVAPAAAPAAPAAAPGAGAAADTASAPASTAATAAVDAAPSSPPKEPMTPLEAWRERRRSGPVEGTPSAAATVRAAPRSNEAESTPTPLASQPHALPVLSAAAKGSVTELEVDALRAPRPASRRPTALSHVTTPLSAVADTTDEQTAPTLPPPPPPSLLLAVDAAAADAEAAPAADATLPNPSTYERVIESGVFGSLAKSLRDSLNSLRRLGSAQGSPEKGNHAPPDGPDEPAADHPLGAEETPCRTLALAPPPVEEHSGPAAPPSGATRVVYTQGRPSPSPSSSSANVAVPTGENASRDESSSSLAGTAPTALMLDEAAQTADANPSREHRAHRKTRKSGSRTSSRKSKDAARPTSVQLSPALLSSSLTRSNTEDVVNHALSGELIPTEQLSDEQRRERQRRRALKAARANAATQPVETPGTVAAPPSPIKDLPAADELGPRAEEAAAGAAVTATDTAPAVAAAPAEGTAAAPPEAAAPQAASAADTPPAERKVAAEETEADARRSSDHQRASGRRSTASAQALTPTGATASSRSEATGAVLGIGEMALRTPLPPQEAAGTPPAADATPPMPCVIVQEAGEPTLTPHESAPAHEESTPAGATAPNGMGESATDMHGRLSTTSDTHRNSSETYSAILRSIRKKHRPEGDSSVPTASLFTSPRCTPMPSASAAPLPQREPETAATAPAAQSSSTPSARHDAGDAAATPAATATDAQNAAVGVVGTASMPSEPQALPSVKLDAEIAASSAATEKVAEREESTPSLAASRTPKTPQVPERSSRTTATSHISNTSRSTALEQYRERKQQQQQQQQDEQQQQPPSQRSRRETTAAWVRESTEASLSSSTKLDRVSSLVSSSREQRHRRRREREQRQHTLDSEDFEADRTCMSSATPAPVASSAAAQPARGAASAPPELERESPAAAVAAPADETVAVSAGADPLSPPIATDPSAAAAAQDGTTAESSRADSADEPADSPLTLPEPLPVFKSPTSPPPAATNDSAAAAAAGAKGAAASTGAAAAAKEATPDGKRTLMDIPVRELDELERSVEAMLKHYTASSSITATTTTTTMTATAATTSTTTLNKTTGRRSARAGKAKTGRRNRTSSAASSTVSAAAAASKGPSLQQRLFEASLPKPPPGKRSQSKAKAKTKASPSPPAGAPSASRTRDGADDDLWWDVGSECSNSHSGLVDPFDPSTYWCGVHEETAPIPACVPPLDLAGLYLPDDELGTQKRWSIAMPTAIREAPHVAQGMMFEALGLHMLTHEDSDEDGEVAESARSAETGHGGDADPAAARPLRRSASRTVGRNAQRSLSSFGSSVAAREPTSTNASAAAAAAPRPGSSATAGDAATATASVAGASASTLARDARGRRGALGRDGPAAGGAASRFTDDSDALDGGRGSKREEERTRRVQRLLVECSEQRIRKGLLTAEADGWKGLLQTLTASAHR